MSISESSRLPTVGEVLAPLLDRVPRERWPLLIAMAERMAAVRYRGWAEQVRRPADHDALHACAAREEDIAARVEGLYPEAAAIQQALRTEIPELDAISRRLFDRPLAEQLRIQADGERLGAATWTSIAGRESDPARRAVLLDCARLEIASAETLERLLAGGVETA